MNAFPAAPDPEVRCLLKAASCEEKEKQSIETNSGHKQCLKQRCTSVRFAAPINCIYLDYMVIVLHQFSSSQKKVSHLLVQLDENKASKHNKDPSKASQQLQYGHESKLQAQEDLCKLSQKFFVLSPLYLKSLPILLIDLMSCQTLV